MKACHPGVLVDLISDLTSSKEPIFVFGPLFLQEDLLPDVRALNVLSSAVATSQQESQNLDGPVR